MEVSKGSLVVEKDVKLDTLYLCMSHTIPSTLLVSKKNECSGTTATFEKWEEKIARFWYKTMAHEWEML